MITFRYELTRRTLLRDAYLIYRTKDLAFALEPPASGSGRAICVNFLEFTLDDQARALFVDGYCPYNAWRKASLEEPVSRTGVVHAILDRELRTGESARINDEKSFWPMFVDARLRRVCIGRPDARGDAIEFCPGCVVVLDGGQLVSLWLRPESGLPV